MINRFYFGFYADINTDQRTYIEHIKYVKCKLNHIWEIIWFVLACHVYVYCEMHCTKNVLEILCQDIIS